MSSLAKNRFSATAIAVNLLLLCSLTFPVGATTISKTNGSIVLREKQSGTPDLKTVNGRIDVDDGIQVGNVKTTNGSITLGKNTIAEDIRTTNGGISIDEGSKVTNIRSTNGGIHIEGTVVEKDIRTNNGDVSVSNHSKVKGSVTTNNGSIVLDAVVVGEDITFTNGKAIIDESVVEGDVIVNESTGSGWSLFGWKRHNKPKVVIGPNSEVKGSVIARQDIDLYIHKSAKVGGIEGAEANYFSSRRP